jgi:glycosyltransferase involved in cell wall biosynthesis
MKLIINTVNLKIGGAFQRSISFLKELKDLGKDEYHIFINENISNQIDVKSYSSNFYFYFFDHSPANLRYRTSVVRRFNFLEDKIKPNAVFSFVGPCYWRAKSPHLVGFGLPHIVYDDYEYVKKYSWKVKLEMIYKKYWTKKEADYYVVQTEDVRERLSNRLNIDKSKIFIVSNGIGAQYKGVELKRTSDKEVKKLLMISTFRPSKNFEIINEVIPYLKDGSFDYEFHITIKQEDYDRVFKGQEKWVKNHEHVLTKDCPDLYNKCDVMFLPSHLECFSASYVEAMKMGRPILTSNLSFATTVCGDAAMYFDNLNPKDIAEKINKIFHDEKLYDNLVTKGKKRLEIFDDSIAQTEKYLEICQNISINKILI